MRKSYLKGGSAATMLAALMLSGCTDAGSMTCDQIAEEAKGISQNQPLKLATVTNVRETARTDAETRCTGDAQLSDGRNTTLYMRAYEEGDNVMVAYQETEF